MKHFSTTNYTNYANWLRRSSCLRIIMLLALFTLHCSLFISEARAQDAFYIYRNDGDFNGFFFDEIKRMGVSKTDLNGEEHDVYVVQEVETADSLYRIPLAAIDSIGFQQPEIRFNKNLIDIDANGLMNYFSSVTGQKRQLFFSHNGNGIPETIIPQVGDVLVSHDKRIKIEGYADQLGLEELGSSSFFSEGFFLGKVTEVKDFAGTLMVYYDYVTDIGDIFEQFITVEQIGYDKSGQEVRRMAGFNPDGALNKSPRRASGNFELTLFSFSGRLQHEWKPSESTSVTVGLDLGMEAKLRATYAITGVISKRLYVKLDFKEKFSAGASVVASVSSDAEIDFPSPLGLLPAIKFPAVFPIFEVNPIPKAFMRVHGQIDGKLAMPDMKIGLVQSITIDTAEPWVMSFDWQTQDKDGEYHFSESDFGDFEASLTFFGFIHGGVKATLGLSTNSWLAKLLHAGIGLEIRSGPKLSGLISGNKDSETYLEFAKTSIDRDLKYKWRVAGKKEERTLWSDTKTYDALRYYLLPEFTKQTEVDYNVTTKTATVTVYPSGNVFTQSFVGAAIGLGKLYEDNELFSYGVNYHPTEDKPESYIGTFQVDTLWAGLYFVYPCVKVDGERYKSLNSTRNDFFIPYEETNDAQEEVTIGFEGGTYSFNAKNNFPSYYLHGDTGFYYTDDGLSWTGGGVDYSYWLEATAKCISANQGKAEHIITFTARPNPTNYERMEIFEIGGHWVGTTKYIKVRQLPMPKENE